MPSFPNFGDGALSTILAILLMVSYGGLFLLYSNQGLLRRANDDLEKRNEYLEAEDNRREAELVQLKADLEAVRRAITGEVHWAALSDTLEAHHREAVDHWKRSERQQAEVVQRLIEIKDRNS